MSVKDEIIRVFKRKVMAHSEGAVVHMGDCGIYNANLGICTCGLHHWLIQAGHEVMNELYSSYKSEETNESLIDDLLRQLRRGNLYIKDADGCFIHYQKPKPLSDEEAEYLLDEIFGKENEEE